VLSDDHTLNPVTDAHGGHPLAHLSWNETGAELAVVDTAGRISIFSISIALNNITTHRQAILDPADDGAQVVGMMWLNTQRSV
jgi:mediator of RNA polymerase II transcription subunit 16